MRYSALLSLVAAGLSFAQAPPLDPAKIVPYPVVADIDFAEGPTFDSKGNLYFVNYLRNGTIGRKTTDGTVSLWVDLGKGRANGLKADAQDRILASDIQAGRVLRIGQDRKIEVLADSYEGKPLLGPNDLCLDRAGNIYFTDPHGSGAQKPIGAIYRISTAGKLTRVAEGLAYPNGIAISADQKRLYTTESGHTRVLVFDLSPEGTLSNKRVFHQFEGGGVDGIDFDEYGRLWVTRWTGKTVDVLASDGSMVASIPAGGDRVTNLTWWGKQLYLTVAGQHSIHRLDVGVGKQP